MLPRTTPARVGVDSRAVLALLDRWEAEGLDVHSLMVVRHGQVAVEGWWSPYAAHLPHHVYSASKTWTACAAGLLVDDGRLRVDERAVDIVRRHAPERLPSELDPAVEAITVHHLLSMSVGHSEDTIDRAWGHPDDLLRGVLSVVPDGALGSRHVYDNGATYAVARVVELVAGERLLDLLGPRLFEPMGLRPGRWLADARGAAYGFFGLHVPTEALASLGQLLLDGGRWQGRQLLSREWVELATRRHIPTGPDPASPDWEQGYGYQVWMSRHGFRGDGANGQFMIVLPEQETVIATTAGEERMQAILDAVWECLLPGLGDGVAEDPVGEAELAARLAGLAIVPVSSRAGGPSEAWYAVSTSDGALGLGTRVSLRGNGSGWLIRVEDGDWSIEVPAGDGAWSEPVLVGREPVTASAGWVETGVAEIVICLVETPHRLLLRCRGESATVAWRTVPLNGLHLAAHL
ncbi:MAG TPA: serine hydrolase domain-containing protein [Dermatophilaceae bacterium]|nr:serine hydrolase domain-containing protein [Dermatophilaceae bacterium]